MARGATGRHIRSTGRVYSGGSEGDMAGDTVHHPDNATPHDATTYDGDVRRTIPHYDAIHEAVLSLVESVPDPPCSWLDTGCGTGTLVTRALSRFPQTLFTVADPSPAMLDTARARLSRPGVTILPPCSTADLPPGRFDIVTAIQCHHYLDHAGRQSAVAACHDRLRPGGLYITSENVRPMSAAGLDLGLRYWGSYLQRTGRSRADVDAHLARLDSAFFPITIEEHIRLYRDAGFVGVEILWCSYLQAAFYAVRGER